MVIDPPLCGGPASAPGSVVVGGGGGLELKTLIDVLPQGRFCAVDPSAEHLNAGHHQKGRRDAGQHHQRIVPAGGRSHRNVSFRMDIRSVFKVYHTGG